jgi:hypothetical protein
MATCRYVAAHHGHLGAVTDDDLEVACVHTGSPVLDHERHARVRPDLQHVVRVAALARSALHDHVHRLGDHRVRRHLQVQRLLGVLRRDGRRPVTRHQPEPARRLAVSQRPEHDLVPGAHLVGRRRPRVVVLGRRVVQSAAKPLQRREPPDLLTPVRHRMVRQVERRHRMQMARDLVARLHSPHDPGALSHSHNIYFQSVP